jgi:hypothetical protein
VVKDAGVQMMRRPARASHLHGLHHRRGREEAASRETFSHTRLLGLRRAISLHSGTKTSSQIRFLAARSVDR